ncbi:P-loop containing nucleoside triphosphate hydrolase protein [Cubamyces sp. BRFM 1775]|nr:P-loop containing nucleoside triphosphate hydrolase protein [Cubamyces sp. BRFM 1775]
MAGLFFRQFGVLFWKNWIVMSKHPWLNLLRCFIMPVAYGIFLAVAQLFLNKPNNYGLGTAVPVPRLQDEYDGSLALIWADGTNGTGTNPSAHDIIAHITRDFSSKQMRNVRQLSSPEDIPEACPQNFNLFSECFAAVAFNSLPGPDGTLPLNYTLRADGGLFHIDVTKHTSDYEKRILPLQWAIDSAIIELQTGTAPETPQEWPFTQETNDEQFTEIRLSYIRGLRTLLVLALFICYVGIAYQLPGSFGGERANLLTAHLKAMGLMDSARILSWHISISLAYLPAWIIVAIIWHFRIFTATNVGLVIVIHLLLGFTLASWSFFVATPFGKSPQLAAVSSTFLAIVFAILALVFSRASTGAAFVFSIIFPPGFYIFAIRAVCGFEAHQIATSVTQPDPDNALRLLPLIIAAIIDVFLWPYLAVLWERRLYDARNPRSGRSWFRRRKATSEDGTPTIGPDIAISIRNLGKDFKTSFFKGEKSLVTAVSDLSLEIPKYGIYVLLGSNGAGKSTTMSILSGLLGRTRGSVLFEGGVERPPRGTIGIVPQKNVLFPELTCYQTLRVWRAVKRADAHAEEDDIEQLLKDCDLGKKIHYNANALSGGQKRKLQLAIGLIGGSKIILVDECTSGVDPLSRRALWRTLSSVKNERTVVFTTHFLDEADLLADTIAVLAAPGKLVAHGTPVALKSSLGEGYTVNVSFRQEGEDYEKHGAGQQTELLDRIRTIAPLTYTTSSAPHEVSYHLKLKDAAVVQEVLSLVEDNQDAHGVASYSVFGTSIEDIFLGLMHDDMRGEEKELEKSGSAETPSLSASPTPTPPVLELTNGRRRSPLSQALTIFHKRVLIARRSWLTPCLALLVGIAGSCVPIFFLSNRAQTCVRTFRSVPTTPLYLPESPLGLVAELALQSRVLESPPGIIATLGNTTSTLLVDNIPDQATFTQTIDQTFRNQSFGGVSVDPQSGEALFAWEATPPGFTGLVMLNLASNILYNQALNATGRAADAPRLILANYQAFPGIAAGTLVALKWVAFFGAAMAVYPAFFSLYVAKERRSSVQAMQLSNGLSDPIGLWLGHLLFDSVVGVINATLIVIIFAAATNQFHGLGFFWVVLVLYGIVGALFSYCVSLVVASPLAAFALSAGYQVIMFVLYLAAYLLVLTYAKTSDAGKDLTIIHYTMSVLSPVASVLRASFVSVNLFSLLCDGTHPVTASSLGAISRYGGPILYLFIYGFVLFAILVWVDSGSLLPRKITHARKRAASPPIGTIGDSAVAALPGKVAGKDVDDEAAVVSDSADALRVLNIVKAFGKASNRVVNNVSFGVSQDTIFALLGPNGAGKTTTFNIIRGDVIPDEGDVFINGVSIVHHPRSARLSLGVCPQFTAIDSQLTVREHLLVYGRLKGLYRGEELQSNVEKLMHATSLHMYADRLASKLSGGNQRKLSLAIALIGNPSVVLIDEFSTGIDAKMKRDMWGTLRNVAVGKAIVITTHSMEEASALANKVGILAKKMLAVGTTDSLVERYATYEVHFSCRTREEVTHAQELMAQIPGARMADDVATRFEVPIGGGMSLAQLFAVLSRGNFSEYTVERATLESVFLKVIRENNVLEEDREKKRQWWKIF